MMIFMAQLFLRLEWLPKQCISSIFYVPDVLPVVVSCWDAVGAKAAKPDTQVILVCGDGSMGWSGTAIDSAVRNNLPILVVVNNNGGMTAAPKGKERIPGYKLGHSDYQLLAQCFGAWGERVEKAADIRPALLRALEVVKSGRTALLNVVTDPHGRSSTYSGFFGEAGEYN